MKDVRSIIRKHGLRATRGREELLGVLMFARRPLSHAQIVERMRGRRMNRVSIYRALEAFVKAGVVHRAYTQERAWTFEMADRCGRDRCHPHFACRGCEAVTCMTGVSVPLVRGLPPGYAAKRQRVLIEGLCPSCSASQTRAFGRGRLTGGG